MNYLKLKFSNWALKRAVCKEDCNYAKTLPDKTTESCCEVISYSKSVNTLHGAI